MTEEMQNVRKMYKQQTLVMTDEIERLRKLARKKG